MKPLVKAFAIIAIVMIVVIGIIAIGGYVKTPERQIPAQIVPQENKTIVVYVTVIPVPTTTPVTHVRIINPVPGDTPKDRPQLLVDSVAPEINWEDIRGGISKEDLGFWLGRENRDWKEGGAREIMYQKISAYIKDYRHGVIVKSARFQKMIYSDKKGVHLAENVTVTDTSEEKKMKAYAVSFNNPNDCEKEMTMIFFYDCDGDIVALGYGNSDLMITKRNFVIGGDSSGDGSSTSSGGGGESNAGGSSDDGGSASDTTIH